MSDIRGQRSNLDTIDLSTMPNCQQMNLVLLQIETVNDSIVADAGAKTVRSFQPMMWKQREAQADLIDLRFNVRAKSR
jgi:hypothetical protein